MTQRGNGTRRDVSIAASFHESSSQDASTAADGMHMVAARIDRARLSVEVSVSWLAYALLEDESFLFVGDDCLCAAVGGAAASTDSCGVTSAVTQRSHSAARDDRRGGRDDASVTDWCVAAAGGRARGEER
ncbi:hypothetical protein MMC34_008544 [Xylographa carneopallida]|nr:hypothetical protein [Xylographa carneopallida]